MLVELILYSHRTVKKEMDKIRDLLDNFKTKKSGHSNQEDDGFGDPFQEAEYSSEEERRRPPFEIGNPKRLLYSQFMEEIDPYGCLNNMEYLFHPLNYKTLECSETIECKRQYCPFFHTQAEKEEMVKFATELESDNFFELLSKELASVKDFAYEVGKTIDEEYENFKDEKFQKAGSPDSASKNNQLLATVVVEDAEAVSLQLVKLPYNSRNKGGYQAKKTKKVNLLVNDGSSQKFYFNQEVKMFEDIKNEFKNFQHLEVNSAH